MTEIAWSWDTPPIESSNFDGASHFVLTSFHSTYVPMHTKAIDRNILLGMFLVGGVTRERTHLTGCWQASATRRLPESRAVGRPLFGFSALTVTMQCPSTRSQQCLWLQRSRAGSIRRPRCPAPSTNWFGVHVRFHTTVKGGSFVVDVSSFLH